MTKLPNPAQYLLRVDDLCPTVNVGRWERLRLLIDEFGVLPILAIVPDNLDKELKVSPPDPEFWARMRAMEASGATIALHGYQHVCNHRGSSLIGMHRTSEFAGVPQDVQRRWIGAGLQILRDQGLKPRVWVAPRHGFDRNTLSALRKEGLHYISDGLARIPFHRGGVTWIPLQLWSPVRHAEGLWSICIHPNSTRKVNAAELRAFLTSHSRQFTSFERVVREFAGSKLGIGERAHEIYETRRLVLRRILKDYGLAHRH